MPGEIASAFVRIRPNMEGFQTETEAGVRGAFTKIAAVAGIALGAKGAFDFGKEIVKSAADVQKQVEVIRAAFGSAGNAVQEFGNKGAAALGISRDLADQTSAKFGILFHNMGVAPGLAAQMTLGFEKLAGGIATIRNVDPATLLAQLPLAAAGNVRSLRALGIATTNAQVAAEAHRIGLTKLVTQALTPAQRAMALYALATAHAGEIQKLAKAHANDYANVQARLGVVWKNLKEDLGMQLLPAMTKLTAFLADNLPKGVAKAQAAFHSIVQAIRPFASVAVAVGKEVYSWRGTFEAIIKPIGGVKGAVIALMAVLAVNKIRAFASSIVSDLVNTGFNKLRVATVAERQEYIASFGAMEVATIGLRDTIRAALLSTLVGAIVVAIGFATEYVITHWDKVSKYTVATVQGIEAVWMDLKNTLIDVGDIIGGSMAASLTLPFRALLEGAHFVSGLLGHFGIHIGGGVNKALDTLTQYTTGLMAKGLANIGKDAGSISSVTGAFSKAFDASVNSADAKSKLKKTSKEAKDALNKALKDVFGQYATDANNLASSPGVTNAAANALFNAGIASAIAHAKERLANAIRAQNSIIQSDQATMGSLILSWHAKVIGAAKAAQQNLDAIANKMIATVDKFFSSPNRQGALVSGPLEQQFQLLKKRLASGLGGPELQKALQQASVQIQSTTANALGDAAKKKALIQKSVGNLLADFRAGTLGPKGLQEHVQALLRREGATAAALKSTLGATAANQLQGLVKGLGLQAKAISKEPASLKAELSTSQNSTYLPKIYDVLTVIAKMNGAIAAKEKKDAGREKKAQKSVDDARHAAQMTIQKEHLRVASHTLTEQRRAAKAAGKLQSTSALMAATVASPFPSSAGKNTGARSTDSRTTASRGLKH